MTVCDCQPCREARADRLSTPKPRGFWPQVLDAFAPILDALTALLARVARFFEPEFVPLAEPQPLRFQLLADETGVAIVDHALGRTYPFRNVETAEEALTGLVVGTLSPRSLSYNLTARKDLS